MVSKKPIVTAKVEESLAINHYIVDPDSGRRTGANSL